MVSLTTIRHRADFVRLRRGAKFVTPYFILRAGPSPVVGQQVARVGYTVTTQCGNAVIRNRIKRRLRALVAEIFPATARAGYDYIFIALDTANPGIADAAFEDLRAAMAKAITGIRL